MHNITWLFLFLIMGEIDMNVHNDVYRRLQQHLDTWPVGFPSTKEGWELDILEEIYTPEEAEFIIKLPYITNTPLNYLPLKEIYTHVKILGINLDQIKKMLETLREKGILRYYKDPNTGKEFYRNLPFNELIEWFAIRYKPTKKYIEASEQYGKIYIRSYMGFGVPQYRTIPINAAIGHENKVIPYDDVYKLLDDMGPPYGVNPCPCVLANQQRGKSCKHNFLWKCLTNNQLLIDIGFAREITKEEAFEILKKGEQEGLVLQPANIKQGRAICMCCSCCCGILTHAKKLSKPAQLFATNYYAEVDSTVCEGNGICVERCPMNAIAINTVSIINRDRCIGCGVCIPTCPSEAIHLKNKEDVIIPPEDWADNHAKIMKRRREIDLLENNT